MNDVFVGIGGNVDSPLERAYAAISKLNQLSSTFVTAVSPIYTTSPVGLTDQPDFINLVVELQTALLPEHFFEELKRIEIALGRTRTIRWGPRVIDLDVLLFGDETINTDALVIPHPRMLERRFVLAPLLDLRPDCVMPKSGIRIADELDRLPAQGLITRTADAPDVSNWRATMLKA